MVGSAVAALAVAVIGQHEGLRTQTYRDIIGVPTICYGETKNVKMGESTTKEVCDDMLIARLGEFEQGVLRCAPGLAGAPAPRLVAHVSLAYNVGEGAYCKSTAARLFNGGKIKASCDAFLKFVRAAGRVRKGLVSRRKEERKLCLQEL